MLPALAALYTNDWPALDLLVPNLAELTRIFNTVRSPDESAFASLDWFKPIDALDVGPRFRDTLDRELPKWVVEEGAVQMAIQLLPAVRMMVVKSGARGALVVGRVDPSQAKRWREKRAWVVSDGGVVVKHFPAHQLPDTADGNVTGAGDTLCGAILAGLVQGTRLDEPQDVVRLIDLAQRQVLSTALCRGLSDRHGAQSHYRDSQVEACRR